MSTYTSRRVTVHAAIATAALAGALLTPSAAQAATPGGATTAAPEKCTSVATIASVRTGLSVTLTNRAESGPKAELKDSKGKIVATVDKARTKDMAAGIAVTGTSTAVPTFSQWVEGGEHAAKNTPFPKLPAGCGTDLGGDTTYKLVNGEKITVHKFSRGHYRAEFTSKGHMDKILGTEAVGGDDDAYVHGMYVVLNSSTGRLSSEFISTRSGCTVTRIVPSVFGPGLSVKLTNGPAGPKAQLRDAERKVRGSADRAHPLDGAMGVKIVGANTATPKLGQRTQGGNTPYKMSAFPSLPKGCATSTPATAATTPAPAPSAHTAGDRTVPRGGVAAGAEVKEQGGDKTALYAGGTGVAALGATGFALLRRRRTAGRV
ncbi:hypothetical protein A8W25_15450 [Streptomyces sp. ERV7]|uniref:hypothetical protein n=1 Tax=Streptomyces sp. ERV7 TaxID=1322334 RepID=UPI0007F4C49E|nr:hypothetical protein [Streptomyces sp. ERV7]OAR23884.1 hypothetical protein A8W25_15450 [Streptomyces sp. ERV7]